MRPTHEVFRTRARWISSLMMVGAAALIGAASWGSQVEMLALSVFAVWLWSNAPGRLIAFSVMFAYFLGASRGLASSAAVFFGDSEGGRSWWAGLAVWLGPNLILAAVWGLSWAKTARGIRAILALSLTSVPPIGIVGWASPLTASAALFPGLGWLGFGATICLAFSLAQVQRARFVLFLGVAIAMLQLPSSDTHAGVEGWVSVETALDKAHDGATGLAQSELLQRMTLDASGTAPDGATLLLPELVAGDWAVDAELWRRVARILRERRQTALIGAYRWDGNGQTANGLFSIGAIEGVEMRERMPVPISMWRPWTIGGTRAYWDGPGVTPLGGDRVGHLVCYEQLLIWPILVTAADRPNVLIGVANNWWARGTSVPAVQRQVVRAWGRLFGIPVVFAANR